MLQDHATNHIPRKSNLSSNVFVSRKESVHRPTVFMNEHPSVCVATNIGMKQERIRRKNVSGGNLYFFKFNLFKRFAQNHKTRSYQLKKQNDCSLKLGRILSEWQRCIFGERKSFNFKVCLNCFLLFIKN